MQRLACDRVNLLRELRHSQFRISMLYRPDRRRRVLALCVVPANAPLINISVFFTALMKSDLKSHSAGESRLGAVLYAEGSGFVCHGVSQSSP